VLVDVAFLTAEKERAAEVHENLVKQEAYLKRRLLSHEANLEDMLNSANTGA
jgi:hypothetical protein